MLLHSVLIGLIKRFSNVTFNYDICVSLVTPLLYPLTLFLSTVAILDDDHLPDTMETVIYGSFFSRYALVVIKTKIDEH